MSENSNDPTGGIDSDTVERSDAKINVALPPRTRALLLLTAGLACVLAFVVVTDRLPKSRKQAAVDQPPPSPAQNEAAPSPGTAAPRPTATDHKLVGKPKVAFATAPLPASADQLQQEARQVAAELLQRFPDTPEALHVAAMMHSQLRESAEAEKLWKRCIELDPKHEGYYVNLAAIAMDRGKSQLAADTLEQAIATGCESPEIYHHLAIAYTQLGRCEEAVQVIKKSLAERTEQAGYWLVLGQAQLKLGKAAEAETSLKKAIELGAQTSDAYFALGNACARLGKQEEAAEYRKKFAELKASQPMDARQRYQILSTAEARRTAMTILLESGTVYSWKGDPLQAEALFLRAVVLDPGRPEPYLALIKLYEAAGMLAEQRATRQRLAELDPHNVVNHLTLAKLSAELGDNEAAEASLKLAAAIAPQSAAVQASLAQFYLQTTRAEQARWHAQIAVRLEPSMEGYRFLASTCRLTGDAEAAEAAMKEAEKLGKN